MDPATLGILGAGVSAAGQLFGGLSSSNAMKYQAAVAKNNATIARQNAEYSIQAGEAQAEKASMRGAANLASIKAGQAASGVDINTGSAVDVQESARGVNKLDTDTTLNNAQLQAYGYRSQETAFEAQAKLDKSAATNALIGGGLGAAGSLLSSASNLSFKWGGSSDTGGGGSGAPSGGGGNESIPTSDLAAQGAYGGTY